MVAFLRPEARSGPSNSLPAAPGPDVGRHLRLVVDNTRSARPESSAPSRGSAGSGDISEGLEPPAPDALSTPSDSFALFALFDRLADRLSTSPVLGPVMGSGPAVALAAALVVGALLAVRVAQGQPPAQDWAGAVAAASSPIGVDVAAAGVDDLVVVATPGDSLWSLADRYAPGHDRRDAIATLADRNGGSTVQVGQRIVIPQELLD